ncbi:MAG: hypothetical protein V3573_01965 [Desulfovibrionaceae bacterium]
MDIMLKSIKSVFPKFDEALFRGDMELAEIKDWDSMQSINLQIELEQSYNVDLSDLLLQGNHTVDYIIAHINSLLKK